MARLLAFLAALFGGQEEEVGEGARVAMAFYC